MQSLIQVYILSVCVLLTSRELTNKAARTGSLINLTQKSTLLSSPDYLRNVEWRIQNLPQNVYKITALYHIKIITTTQLKKQIVISSHLHHRIFNHN